MKNVTALALFILSTSAFAKLTFQRDSRLADGDKKVLTIVNENSRHGAYVTLESSMIDRQTGKNFQQTLIDEKGMDCTTTKDAQGLVEVRCVKDKRLVDGPKVEIIVRKNESIGFDVLRDTTIVSRSTGKEGTVSEIMAYSLR